LSIEEVAIVPDSWIRRSMGNDRIIMPKSRRRKPAYHGGIVGKKEKGGKKFAVLGSGWWGKGTTPQERKKRLFLVAARLRGRPKKNISPPIGQAAAGEAWKGDVLFRISSRKREKATSGANH